MLCRSRAEQNPSQRLHIHAAQRVISRSRPTRHQTHEQRIQSVQAKLTLRHPKTNVSAGQRPAQVGRVGLEPTADGL